MEELKKFKEDQKSIVSLQKGIESFQANLKELESNLEKAKEALEEKQESFRKEGERIIKPYSYPYIDWGFCGKSIGYQVIIDGTLYSFRGVKDMNILLSTVDTEWFDGKKGEPLILSPEDFLKRVSPSMKSIRTIGGFSKGDKVFIKGKGEHRIFKIIGSSDKKAYMYIDSENDRIYNGEILRIFENGQAIVELVFPSIGGGLDMNILVNLEDLISGKSSSDILENIKNKSFEITSMGGFKIGDIVYYKNNKEFEERKGVNYYEIKEHGISGSFQFMILGFFEGKVIVGAFEWRYFSDEEDREPKIFQINDISEIEKIPGKSFF
jgi:hypothetical protein